MTNATAQSETLINLVNGVNVDTINGAIETIQADTGFGQFQFRASNEWLDGSINRSAIADYTGANKQIKREQPFKLINDEPPVLDGVDSAPNPVEYVLHALAGCLTTTMIYHAAVRGIVIESCKSELEGDLDLRGLLGLADDVRKGYHHVRVRFTVKSDADADTLKELAMFSPVYDIVSNSLPVELTIDKA